MPQVGSDRKELGWPNMHREGRALQGAVKISGRRAVYDSPARVEAVSLPETPPGVPRVGATTIICGLTTSRHAAAEEGSTAQAPGPNRLSRYAAPPGRGRPCGRRSWGRGPGGLGRRLGGGCRAGLRVSLLAPSAPFALCQRERR